MNHLGGHKNNSRKRKTNKKPLAQKGLLSLRVEDGDSISQDQVSQLSQTPAENIPQVILSMQSNQIYKYHKQNIGLRHKILRTIAFAFYPFELAAFLSEICSIIEQKLWNEVGKYIVTNQAFREHESKVEGQLQKLLTVRKQDLLRRFYDAETNIALLRDYKIIVDRDDSAEEIKVNTKFFNMLKGICQDMRQRVSAEKEKEISREDQVKCKKCGKKRQLYEIQAKNPCQEIISNSICGSFQAVTKDKTHSNRRLVQNKALQDVIGIIQKCKNEMDELRIKQIQRIKLLRQKNLQNNRVTDADKDVKIAIEFIEKEKPNLANFGSPWEKYPIKKNGVYIKLAEKQFSPRRFYPKIQELRELGETRKRRKIQIVDQQLYEQL